MIRSSFNWQRAYDKAPFIYFLVLFISLRKRDVVQIDFSVRDTSFLPVLLELYEKLCISDLIWTAQQVFKKRTAAHGPWGCSPFMHVVSGMLVFWADTSPSHQRGTSGPPGAVVKCHSDPLLWRRDAIPVLC